MNENVKFYVCPICGNIIGLIEGNAENILCCGKKMQKMVANSTDAASEKHVPVYEKIEDEVVVRVGEIEHPMEKDQYIMWIAQVSDNKTTLTKLFIFNFKIVFSTITYGTKKCIKNVSYFC